MKRISLLLILVFILSNLTHAQDDQPAKRKKKKGLKGLWEVDSSSIESNLVINDAFVTREEQLLKGVVVNVLVNGEITEADTTDKEGGFNFKLKFDHRYVLSFEKEGFINKKVEIDLTKMPVAAKSHGYDLGRFQMEMLPYAEGMNVEDYKVPVARYAYDEVNEMIALDRAYFKERKELLAQVNQSNEKVSASAQAEADEIQEEYNILIRDADIEFEAKDYKLAKQIYLEALELKPLAEYPRKQINIINMYLEKDLGLEEKYQTLIAQGDEAYEAKDYESAELAYKSAMKIKTTDPYPRDQLKKIEELEAAKKAEAVKEEKKVYSLAGIQISNENKGFSNALAKKYPQGLTVEKYMEGSKAVERRIIVDGDIGVEYKKITHNWGGVYYFKNNKPVDNFVWQKEAIQ